MNSHFEHTEKNLLKRLSQGDAQAFTEIYNAYWDRLYFIAHKHTKSAPSAEEIVQDVFLNIWRLRESIAIDNLSAYLASMTRYEVYRHLAKQKKYVSNDDLSESSPNSFEHFDQKMLLEIVEKLSHRLPEKCRLVFVHNKLLDKSLDVVAAEMEISSKTAEAHLTKALKIIRGNLKRTLLRSFLFF